MSTLDDIRARDAGWKENIANCNYESHAPLSAEGTSQIIGDRRYLIGIVDNWRAAFQLIAEQTVCPDLFPNDDGDKLCVKTAMTIALAALDKLEAP